MPFYTGICIHKTKTIFISLIISIFQSGFYHQHAKTCLFENENFENGVLII